MSWYLLSILSAFFQSCTDVLSKKNLQTIPPATVSFALAAVSAFFLALLLPTTNLPNLSFTFLVLVLISSLIDAVALLLYMRALKDGEISLVLPLKMLTPLFLLFTSPIMLGEYASINGVFGVLLIIAGSYILNTSSNQTGIFAPFKAILSYRPSQYMVLCAALFGVNCNIHKAAIELSTPLTYAFIHQIIMTALLLPCCIKELDVETRQAVTKHGTVLIVVGLCVALTMLCHLIAMQTGLVVYTTALKRTSILISICIAYFFFNEKNLIERMAGTCVMICGVVITSL